MDWNIMNTIISSLARHRLAKILVICVIAALPIGITVAPATAETAAAADHPWQSDCDHNGPWQWQENRGNWEFNNCDNNNGHWERHGDRDNGNWMWQRDRDDTPQQPPAFSFFGSS